MDRSFISRVESGRCNPSPDKLRLIAQRLGKPVEYFCTDSPGDESLDLVIALLESAERDIAGGDAAAVVAASRKVRRALSLSVGLERKDLEARVRLGLIRCLRQQHRDAELLVEGERALTCLQEAGSHDDLAFVYMEMGGAAYRTENFPAARSLYERAALYWAGVKRRQRQHGEALMFLGSSLYWLGDYREAVRSYQEALTDCPGVNDSEFRGRIAMGLGWALFRAADTDPALRWTQEALADLGRCDSRDYVLALHNLAIIESTRGHGEQAHAQLLDCLVIYQAQGRTEEQAGILEELAGYWLQRGDLDRAETLAWEALALLSPASEGVLKGRLLRLLGTASRGRGAHDQGRGLLLMSYDILRRLQAKAEAEASLEALQRA